MWWFLIGWQCWNIKCQDKFFFKKLDLFGKCRSLVIAWVYEPSLWLKNLREPPFESSDHLCFDPHHSAYQGTSNCTPHTFYIVQPQCHYPYWIQRNLNALTRTHKALTRLRTNRNRYIYIKGLLWSYDYFIIILFIFCVYSCYCETSHFAKVCLQL